MSMSSEHRWKIVLILAAFTALGNAAGCTNRKSVPTQKVQGTVKYRGKLLDHGQVVFLPQDVLSGMPAIGPIQSDGSYRLQFNDDDGIVEGKYRVLVQCRQLPPASKTLAPVLLPSLIPAKYGDEKSSPLLMEVKAGVKEYPLVLE